MATFRCPDPCASSSTVSSTIVSRKCEKKCDPRLCPYCGLGVFVKNTSVSGYIAAALCFPFGIYCCLTKSCCYVVECSYCRAVTDRSLDDIYYFPSDEEKTCKNPSPKLCLTLSEAETRRKQKVCENKWWWLKRNPANCKQRQPSNPKPPKKQFCYEKPPCPKVKLPTPRYKPSIRVFHGGKTDIPQTMEPYVGGDLRNPELGYYS